MNAEIRHLVDQCIADDESATLDLIERFRARVFALCFRMLGQRQDAEDIVQETLVRMIRSLKTWDSHREFEPWLLQIAANRCRTFLAKKQRRPAAEMLFENEATDQSTSHGRAADMLNEEVNRALVQVRTQWREAFLLFHREELSYQEISEQLQVPMGTVKTWVHRARRELIQELKDREVV